MIKSLRVRNYLYIKDANLSFVSGINALIGESGVGKSVIVNILALPFGKKPAENPIGKWADKAEIEIIFLAQEQEYTLNIVIGSRVGFKLNEKVVSHEKIKDIWSKFLNIHSQGERDYLYYDQLQIFDSFIPDMQSVKSLYESEYAEFELLKEELNVLEKKILTDEQKELYLFQLKEIERVSPVLGEDEEMFIALKQAKNKELFASLVSDLNFLLDGFADSIKQADKKIKDLVSMELFSENLVKKSASIKENLDDIRWELSKVDSPDNEINAQSVESRLNELEKLKSKFKLDLDQIIIKKEHLTESLDEQDFLLAKRDKLMIEMDNQKKELLARAQVLSQKRRDNTVRMEQALKLVFKKLKLEYAEIAVFFSAKQQPSFSGMDDISILIRVNSNTKMVPLTELSGGETSRVLLALKDLYKIVCLIILIYLMRSILELAERLLLRCVRL